MPLVAAGVPAGVLDYLMFAIASSQGTIVLCGFIVLFGLVFGQRFLRRKSQLEAELNTLRDIVDPYVSAKDFRHHLEDVDAQMLASPFSADAWREFREAFIYPEDPDAPLRTSRHAAEFFGFEAIGASRMNLRMYSAVPNWLTGLGILGTFLGLVGGLHVSSQGLALGMQTNDTAAMTEAVMPLLKGASTAFYTSVCGLVGSLIFSFYEKRMLHALHETAARTASRIDSLLDNVTLEQLAAEDVTVQRAQLLQLQQFNTDLAVTIANALEARLTDRFAPALAGHIGERIARDISQSVQPTLERIATGLDSTHRSERENLESVLEALVAKFTDAMSGAAGSEMQALGATLGELNRSLAASADVLASSQAGLQAVSEELGTKLSGTLTDVSNRLSEIADRSLTAMTEQVATAGTGLANKLQEAGDSTTKGLTLASVRLQDTIVGLQETFENMRASQSKNEAILVEAQNAVRAMTTAQTQFAQTTKPMHDSLQRLTTANEKALAAMDSLKLVVVAIDKTVQTLKTSQERTEKVWAGYADRFETVDEGLGKFVDHLNTGVIAYGQQVEKQVKDIDQHFSTAVRQLSGAIQQLHEVVEELQ